MTIVSALKKLHKKMTGKDATGLNIANVIDSLQENYTGGGGDTYDTVLEVAVGTMEYSEPASGYMWTLNDYSGLPSIDEAVVYYFNVNDKNTKSYFVKSTGESDMLGFNMSDQGAPINPSEPYYAVVLRDGPDVQIFASEDISNKTVRVLKKTWDGIDTALSESSETPVQNKVIAAALADKMDADAIPEADAEYNGLVLGIKDGEYDFLPASRIEGGPICVTITEDNGSYVTDITPNELIAALEAGSIIQVHYKIVTGNITRYVNYNYEALTVQEGTGYGLTVSIYDSDETTLRKYITFVSADGDTAFSATAS